MDFTFGQDDFRVGDFVVYANGGDGHKGPLEVGVVKRVCADGCFVGYHLGDTASKTPFDCLVPVKNDFVMAGLVERARQLGRKLDDLPSGTADWGSPWA